MVFVLKVVPSTGEVYCHWRKIDAESYRACGFFPQNVLVLFKVAQNTNGGKKGRVHIFLLKNSKKACVDRY